MFGEIGHCCESSITAEFGVGSADGTEAIVGIGVLGKVASSLLTICG